MLFFPSFFFCSLRFACCNSFYHPFVTFCFHSGLSWGCPPSSCLSFSSDPPFFSLSFLALPPDRTLLSFLVISVKLTIISSVICSLCLSFVSQRKEDLYADPSFCSKPFFPFAVAGCCCLFVHRADPKMQQSGPGLLAPDGNSHPAQLGAAALFCRQCSFVSL